MKLLIHTAAIFCSLATLPPFMQAAPGGSRTSEANGLEDVIKPRVFIISMFSYEEGAWYGIPQFNLFARNISVPGFSPLYPDAHCTADGDICQLTTGESGMYR